MSLDPDEKYASRSRVTLGLESQSLKPRSGMNNLKPPSHQAMAWPSVSTQFMEMSYGGLQAGGQSPALPSFLRDEPSILGCKTH